MDVEPPSVSHSLSIYICIYTYRLRCRTGRECPLIYGCKIDSGSPSRYRCRIDQESLSVYRCRTNRESLSLYIYMYTYSIYTLDVFVYSYIYIYVCICKWMCNKQGIGARLLISRCRKDGNRSLSISIDPSLYMYTKRGREM